MKKFALGAFMLCCISAKAQLKIPLKNNNDISPVLEKVICDYPNDFANIKGALIEEQPSVINYACVLNIKGMPPGIISQYGYEAEHAFSWKNTLLETDNFNDAKTKFRLYYNHIKKTVAAIEKLEIKLDADYVEPDEFKSFNTIRFKLETMQDLVKDVTVELNMQYEMDHWTITMGVFHIEDAANSITSSH